MEKVRIGVFLFFLIILGVLTFSLSKTWRLYEGYEVLVDPIPEKNEKKETESEPLEGLDWEDGNGRILFKQIFLYPHGLVTERGGYGPDGILSHARNLTVVSLKTGTIQKLFPRDVYIWDFFPAEFSKKNISNNIDEPKEEILALEKRLLILAATIDTNDDGFLNQKDDRLVFLFNPETGRLDPILPKGYHFRKLLFNSLKNHLTLMIGRNGVDKEGKPKRNHKNLELFLFDYDAQSGKSVLSASLQQ